MFSSKVPSRKQSRSKAGNESAKQGKKRAMASADLRVTFENVICSVSAYQEDLLDKETVIKCLKSLYDWMVFDSDMQLWLPVPPGPNQAKMWPHGARVNTRKDPEDTAYNDSSKRLKEVSK